MIPYTLQIDFSSGKDPNGYFDVSVISVAPFTESQLDTMPTMRKKWGEVTVKNDPFSYSQIGGNRYKLYDIIQSLKPTQEIRIKLISDYETIEGYFGVVDCSVNDDEKVMNFSPTIIDQYTPYIENREKEIKILGQNNIIRNGSFNSWENGMPIGWEFSGIDILPVQDYLADKTVVKLGDVQPTEPSFDNDGIKQTVPNIKEGSNLNLSFDWMFTGNYASKFNLKMDVYLVDDFMVTYRLSADGKWNAVSELIYRKQAIQIPETSVTEFNAFLLKTDKTPCSGTLTIIFYTIYWNTNEEWYIALTDVNISTAEIQVRPLKIELPSEKLVTFEQKADEIKIPKKVARDRYFFKYLDDDLDISTFFNVDGSPNFGTLAGAMESNSGSCDYSNLIDIFGSKESESYKFQLSKLTVYHGKQDYATKRRFYGIAEYSREEYYLADPEDWNEDTDTLIPPEDKAGWDWTVIIKNGKRLWVRFPFNDAAFTWDLDAKIDSPKTTHPYGFYYHHSQTTTKQYPVRASSLLIKESIELREFIRKIYTGTSDELIGKNIYSTFLWNDAQTPEIQSILFPDGRTSDNYVTGEFPNPLNNIAVVHTNDLKTNSNVNSEDSILKTSGKVFMSDFFILFSQCYIFIDTEKNLWIEHLKYFDLINKSKNLTTDKYAYIRKYKSWDYVSEKMYSLIKYGLTNSGYDDFKSSDITFEKITSNKRGEDIKIDYATRFISTDIQYCVENPTSINNGVVLVNYQLTFDGSNVCKYSLAQKTNKVVLNGELSIATLISKYATYEGTWEKGKINEKDVIFNYTNRYRKGKEIIIKGIFLDKIILTELGIGVVTARTIDYENENTKIIAHYRYEDNYIAMAEGEIVDVGDASTVIPELAVVSTSFTIDIGEMDATMGGNVTDSGSVDVTDKGIIYSTNASTLISLGTQESGGSGIGSFSIQITDLIPNKTYYVIAYAVNSVGVSYGSIKNFKTLPIQI